MAYNYKDRVLKRFIKFVLNNLTNFSVEAEHILTHEADYLEMPCGLPTPSSIDLGRLDAEEKVKIHPPLL